MPTVTGEVGLKPEPVMVTWPPATGVPVTVRAPLAGGLVSGSGFSVPTGTEIVKPIGTGAVWVLVVDLLQTVSKVSTGLASGQVKPDDGSAGSL